MSLEPRARGMLHLSTVYLCWGSTYLAIRLAVRDGAGFPPFQLGAVRTFVAGGLLLLWAALLRRNVRVTARELKILMISGALLWVGGNGLVNWAEQHAHSGYAALLVGSLPLWTAIMDTFIDRKAPTLELIAALLIGFSGLGVLSYPAFQSSDSADIGAVIALTLAVMSWGIGMMLYSRSKLTIDTRVAAGYQHLTGAVGFTLVALLLGEPLMTPTPAAWGAVAYLIIAGSLLASTSFLTALNLLPVSVVATYAYVNPVIAVLLGWAILDEPITLYTVIGSALIILGVAGTFHAKRAKTKTAH